MGGARCRRCPPLRPTPNKTQRPAAESSAVWPRSRATTNVGASGLYLRPGQRGLAICRPCAWRSNGTFRWIPLCGYARSTPHQTPRGPKHACAAGRRRTGTLRSTANSKASSTGPRISCSTNAGTSDRPVADDSKRLRCRLANREGDDVSPSSGDALRSGVRAEFTVGPVPGFIFSPAPPVQLSPTPAQNVTYTADGQGLP
jgi:hypothetical protein